MCLVYMQIGARSIGQIMKKHLWMCANTTIERQFDDMLELLYEKDNFGTTKNDLLTYPPRFWCKAFFRIDVKCDVCHTNLFETLNGTLVQARHKPNHHAWGY